MYPIPSSMKKLTVDVGKCENTGVPHPSCIILVYKLSTLYFMLLTLGIRILKL